MLSGLFDLSLPLNNPSKTYRRLGGVLGALAFFVSIKYSDPPILIHIMIHLCLGYAICQIIRHPCPHVKLQSLRLERDAWIVTDNQGKNFTYSCMRRVVDTGFYVVLHLSRGHNRSRLLVVFYDQIPIDTLRQLNRLSKIKKA